MAGNADESPIRGRAAFPGFLIRPQLRRDNEHAMERGRQHLRIWRHVHVVVNLVGPIEVRHSLDDWMFPVHEINADLALQPSGLFVAVPAPGTALDFFGPVMLVAAHDTVVDYRKAAPAPEKLFEGRALVAGDVHA